MSVNFNLALHPSIQHRFFDFFFFFFFLPFPSSSQATQVPTVGVEVSAAIAAAFCSTTGSSFGLMGSSSTSIFSTAVVLTLLVGVCCIDSCSAAARTGSSASSSMRDFCLRWGGLDLAGTWSCCDSVYLYISYFLLPLQFVLVQDIDVVE